MPHSLRFLLLLGAIALFSLTDSVQAQEQAALRVVVQPDSSVIYVYHTAALPLGYGVHVYRRDPGEGFERLTEMPLHGVQRGSDLPQALGTRYDVIRRALDQPTATTTLLKLRTDRFAAATLSFLHPPVAHALGRLYVDRTAPLGETVTYRVEVVDDRGEPDGPVLEETIVLAPRPMPVPGNVRAQHLGEGRVRILWDYPRATPQAEDDVMQFDVYRLAPFTDRAERLNDVILLRNNAQTTFSHTAMLPVQGQTERFYVVPRDVTERAGPPSAVAEVRLTDVQPPASLPGLDARIAGADAVALSWPASTDPNAAGYLVHRSRLSIDGFAPIQEEPLPVDQTSYVDTTAVPGRLYYYRVAVVDTAGNQSELSPPAQARIKDEQPPAAPQALTAAYDADARAVQLAWRDPQPAPDLHTYYLLRRRVKPYAGRALAQVNEGEILQEANYVDDGIAGAGFEEGALYRYAVVSVDSSRNISDSATVVIQIPNLTPPEPPTNVRADAPSAFRIHLTWNPSPSGDAVEQVVYRQRLGEADAAAVQRVDARTRFLRDEDVQIGEAYIYRVSAVDSVGNESAWSAPDTLRLRDGDPPQVVRNVRAEVQPGGVALAWEPARSPDLAGYRVERAAIPTGVYDPVHETLLTEEAWTDPNGNPAAWYRVRAIDTSGNTSRPSRPAQAR